MRIENILLKGLKMSFNGLGMNLGNLAMLSKAKTRSISPENRTGGKGEGAKATDGTGANAARDLGKGWKVSPSLKLEPGETLAMADIEGPGAIQQIWLTGNVISRNSILRIYWDKETTPSVECPVSDFFCCGWEKCSMLSSLPVCVNPGSGLNCYWEMPFRKHCLITLENRSEELATIFY